MVIDQPEWRDWMAQIIKRKLQQIDKANVTEEFSFADELNRRDPLLWDAANIEDPSLNAVFNLADRFFDAKLHNFPSVDGLSWERATSLLLQAVDCLERGEQITDAVTLSYVWPRRK